MTIDLALEKLIPGLQEMNFGRFEGKSADELSGDPAYQVWVDAMCLTPIPEGESVTDFKTRCCEAFTETIKNVPDGSRVGFVVHGGVIAGFMMTWFGGLRVDWYRKAGTGYQVTFENGAPIGWVRVPEDL